jgi:CRISPR-associated protein Cmr1
MSRFPTLSDGSTPSSLREVLHPQQAPSTTRLEYECELITPMYGGGVEPGQVDRDMPIRATAIRGQLRFWWRLLYGTPGDDAATTFSDEREIWGGLGNTPEEVSSSNVNIRVENLTFQPTDIAPAARPTFNERSGRYDMAWSGVTTEKQGLQYALFAAQGKCHRDTGQHDEKNPAPGTLLKAARWTLVIDIKEPLRTASPDQLPLKDQVTDAIRWWAALGGVGARTRRGLGAVKVTHRDAETSQALCVNEDEVLAKGGRLHFFGAPFKAGQAATELNTLLTHFRNFRQGPTEEHGAGYGRQRQTEPETKRPAGRSNWPEADLVRTATDKWFGKDGDQQHRVRGQAVGTAHNHAPKYKGAAIYPRARFGLPLVMQFIDKNDGDPGNVTIVPVVDGEEKERLASPVILRTCIGRDGDYRAALLVLPESRTDTYYRIKGDGVNMDRLSAKPVDLRPAWTEPVEQLIGVLAAQMLLAPKTSDASDPRNKLTGPVRWGKVRVQRNRTNGTLEAKHPETEKTATRSGADAKALLETLPLDLRQKLIDKGGYHLLVTVKNGEITKLEPAP